MIERLLRKRDERGRRALFPYYIWHEKKEATTKSSLLFGRQEKWKEGKDLVIQYLPNYLSGNFQNSA